VKQTVILFDLDYTLFNTDIYRDGLKDFSLYAEVENTLKNLADHAVLGIFSEGETDLQKLKITNTGLDKYFSDLHIHVFASKKDFFTFTARNYTGSKIILVDDKLEVLFSAKNDHPEIKTVWIKRGKYAENQQPIENFKPDLEVLDLKDLDKKLF